MLISYTFVNTFDYTNAAGLRIKSDQLNAIQLAPGIKLIANTKNNRQPYIGVSMVLNLLDKAKITAFAQTMIHNDGRNGISLLAGMRWKIGKAARECID